MLTKRTNILFSQKRWQELTKLAKKEQKSVAELIRQAIEDRYFSSNGDREDIARAVDSILRHRQRAAGRIDYKQLINDGRRL